MPWAENGLLYVGNCEWEPSGDPVPDPRPNELTKINEPWLGRSDKLEEFRAAYYLGRPYLGGYITSNKPVFNSPFYGMATVDLEITAPPPTSEDGGSGAIDGWGSFSIQNSTSTKTASKSASVAGDNLIPASRLPDGVTAPNPLECARDVSYEAPQTTYTYFASSKPDGPRFAVVASTREPRILRSRITARLSSGDVVFTGTVAPAAIVTALDMPFEDKVTNHTADAVQGTPWYRCSDTVTRELKGDS